MPQPFLETGQQGLLIAGFDIDHPVRRQPGGGKAGGEQIRIAQAPQDLPAQPRHDAGGEQAGHGAIQRAIAGAGHLMQRP